MYIEPKIPSLEWPEADRLMRIRWLYTLIVLPFIIKWIEIGRLPNTLWEGLSAMVLSLSLATCVWIACRQAEQLEALSEFDGLTDLRNSRMLHTDLRREVKRARRQRTALCLAYIDLDNFKMINDNHGHAEGDAALRRLADLLLKNTRRDVDACYRIGGDEFAVILPGIRAGEADLLLERVAHEARQQVTVLAREGVSLSVGVVELNLEETSGTFLRRADALMYQVKKGGKGRVSV